MSDRFHGSRLKIARAKEHIQELDFILKRFLDSDFYTVRVEQDADGINFLAIDLNLSEFPCDRCALIIGDAVHNLRSALDLFYYVSALSPGKWSVFPIILAPDDSNDPVVDARKKLETTLEDRIAKKQITVAFGDFIRDRVKTYEGGNFYLAFLHHLNNWDKHKLLIPMFQAVEFQNIRLYDDEQRPIGPLGRFFYAPHSSRFRIDGYDGRKLTCELDENRHPTAQIFFNFGSAFQDQAIILTLGWIAEEVTRTVELFDTLGIV